MGRTIDGTQAYEASPTANDDGRHARRGTGHFFMLILGNHGFSQKGIKPQFFERDAAQGEIEPRVLKSVRPTHGLREHLF